MSINQAAINHEWAVSDLSALLMCLEMKNYLFEAELFSCLTFSSAGKRKKTSLLFCYSSESKTPLFLSRKICYSIHSLEDIGFLLTRFKSEILDLQCFFLPRAWAVGVSPTDRVSSSLGSLPDPGGSSDGPCWQTYKRGLIWSAGRYLSHLTYSGYSRMSPQEEISTIRQERRASPAILN